MIKSIMPPSLMFVQFRIIQQPNLKLRRICGDGEPLTRYL